MSHQVQCFLLIICSVDAQVSEGGALLLILHDIDLMSIHQNREGT